MSIRQESRLPDFEEPGGLSRRDVGFVAVVAGLLAAGHSIAAPFVANQNQYLVHAVGDRDPQLTQDWLVQTTDPYPLFSALAGLIYDLGGVGALRVAALLCTYVALVAVFILARGLWPGSSLGVPVVAMVLVGMTLSVGRVGSFIPIDWSVSAFQGFAGQYLLIKPGYFQPSSVGVLVLLAFAIGVVGFRSVGRRAFLMRSVAVVLTVVASALAPTYLVVAFMGIIAAGASDLVTGARLQRFPWYVTTLVLSGAAAIVANPDIISLGLSDSESRAALSRLAFEAFPIHTLFTSWPPDDSTLLLVIAVSIILLPGLFCGGWMTRWLLFATGAALLAAIVVYVVRSPSLAFLYPWRVSVIVAPVAATVIAVRLASLLRRLPRHHWRWKVILVAAVIAIPGIASTVAKESPASAEAPVAVAVAAQPEGIGLIPPTVGTLRLNARLPIYVDLTAPPYISRDLVEWWNRVEAVNRFWSDPESFCSIEWSQQIDWILIPDGVSTPTCIDDWQTRYASAGWRVIQRTP